jgi:hypothetical protein
MAIDDSGGGNGSSRIVFVIYNVQFILWDEEKKKILCLHDANNKMDLNIYG